MRLRFVFTAVVQRTLRGDLKNEIPFGYKILSTV